MISPLGALEAIIPALLRGGGIRVKSLLEEIVASLFHVPEHRRTLVCTTLMNVLDQQQSKNRRSNGNYLSSLITLYLSRGCTTESLKSEAVSFLVALLAKYSPMSAVTAFRLATEQIWSLMENADETLSSRDESKEPHVVVLQSIVAGIKNPAQVLVCLVLVLLIFLGYSCHPSFFIPSLEHVPLLDS